MVKTVTHRRCGNVLTNIPTEINKSSSIKQAISEYRNFDFQISGRMISWHKNMILNTGVVGGDFVKWSIWEDYSHDDLIDFLNQKGKFISLMNTLMEKYDKRMKLDGKTLVYESYKLNMATLYLKCDEELWLLEKVE